MFWVRRNSPKVLRWPICTFSSRTERSLLQLPDFDVSKPTLVLVIGQQDVAFDFVPEARRVLELAPGNSFFHRSAAGFVSKHSGAIEPVFYAQPADDNPRRVPFTCRFQHLVLL